MVRLKCHSQYELRHMLEITLVQKFQDHFQQCIQLPTPFQFSIPKSQKCFHSCVWMNVGAKTLRHASNLRFKNKKAGWLFQEPKISNLWPAFSSLSFYRQQPSCRLWMDSRNLMLAHQALYSYTSPHIFLLSQASSFDTHT